MDHRESLEKVIVNKRIIYKSVGWWLKYGNRPESDLSCIHDVKLNRHCPTCALKTRS